MKVIEDYDLLFNEDGDALLIIDPLPGAPDNPVMELRDGKAMLRRGPGDVFEIIGLEANHLDKLAQLAELEVMEQVEPELGESIQEQREYTAIINI